MDVHSSKHTCSKWQSLPRSLLLWSVWPVPHVYFLISLHSSGVDLNKWQLDHFCLVTLCSVCEDKVQRQDIIFGSIVTSRDTTKSLLDKVRYLLQLFTSHPPPCWCLLCRWLFWNSTLYGPPRSASWDNLLMLTVQRREAKLQRWRWQITAVPSALFISPLSFLLPASIRLTAVNCTVNKWRIVKSQYKSSHSADLLACPPTRNRGSQGHSTATSPRCRLRVVLKTTVRYMMSVFPAFGSVFANRRLLRREEETLELNHWDVKYV